MAQSDIKSMADAVQSPFPVIFLDFRSVDRFLYRIRDLSRIHNNLPQELIDRLGQCHLYMICKRPRLTISPNSIHWNDDIISLKVSYQIQGVIHECEAEVIRTPDLQAAASFVASGFPHRELLALDKNGNVLQEMLLANYAHLIASLPLYAKQLEVLYIGKGLSKNAQDRLARHVTLQKVLADINSDDPDSEVFAIVFCFDYRRSITGTILSDGDEARNRLQRKKKPYTPNLDDKISLIEAAAISYFQTTKYNTHYLDFPTTDSDAAARARSAGADLIVVQIDTENIGSVEVYSQSVSPQSTHEIVRFITR